MRITFDEEYLPTTQSIVAKLKTKHPGKQLHLQSPKQNEDDKYRVFLSSYMTAKQRLGTLVSLSSDRHRLLTI